MNNPKISVIVPVYNVEEYLEECLESILNQSMIDDIEVIMVDDGSTDNSRYITEKYALDYENFHAYHKENEGQSIARNYGMKYAKGDYIVFLDADDYISPNTYEELYNFISTNENDVVTGRFNRFTDYNAWEELLSKNSFKNVEKDIASTHIRELTDLVWDTISCNKIYKREFLNKNNLQFPNERILFEDIIFTFKTYYLAKSVGILNKNIYYWRIRSNKSSSTQNNLSTFNSKSRFKILKQIKQFIDEHNVEDNITNALYEKWLNHDLKVFLKKINNYPTDYHIELIKEVNDFLKLTPNKIRLNLNSYLQILYKMVENEDLESILEFVELEADLKDNPEDIRKIKEEYKQYINLEKDVEKENLISKVENISNDDENILIEFSEYLPYMSKNSHETIVKLINHENREHILKIYKNTPKTDEEEAKNKTIVIPTNLLNKENSRIKITYKTSNLEKERYLKNDKRNRIKYPNFDVDIGIGMDTTFLIKTREKNDNDIIIENIKLKDNYFELTGKSTNKIKNLLIENVINFKKIIYPVEYIGEQFKIEIPYNDIINAPIKKWELKSKKFNSLKLLEKYEVLNEKDKTLFTNRWDKILIENSLYDKNQYAKEKLDLEEKNRQVDKEIKKLKKENEKIEKENEKIEKENEKMKKENEKLQSIIEAYKNRKVVKLADKANELLH